MYTCWSGVGEHRNGVTGWASGLLAGTVAGETIFRLDYSGTIPIYVGLLRKLVRDQDFRNWYDRGPVTRPAGVSGASFRRLRALSFVTR
jgi:hypothetical protein